MQWLHLALAVVVSGVIASFSDWFFMGVLFHDRYLIKPEIWRNPPGGNNTRLIIWSEAVGLISSAALAWLLLLSPPLSYPRALTIAAVAWAIGPVPVLWQNAMWTKMDGLVSVSHALGWLVRLVITAVLVCALV